MATPLPDSASAQPEPAAERNTRHAPVPIDSREWRIRTEARCNAMLFVAVGLLLSTYLAHVAWLAMVSLGLGLSMLVGSVWLRPELPWRAPPTRHIDDADLEAMRPPTRPFPASPPHGWSSPSSPSSPMAQRLAAANAGAGVGPAMTAGPGGPPPRPRAVTPPR